MTFEELTARAESGPYAFLYRTALKNNYVQYNTERRFSGMWATSFMAGEVRRCEGWLCESLATALEHPDRIIATRAAFQARQYATKLIQQGLSIGGPQWHDALRDAVQRVVDFVAEGSRAKVERDAALARIAEQDMALFESSFDDPSEI